MKSAGPSLWLKRLLLLSGSAVIGIVLLEVFIRLTFGLLPLQLANQIGAGYSSIGSGIYRFDPEWNMPRMRKHYTRSMFFNGYTWRHQTDWMGYRNPRDMHQADIVLLGDSMIYGHGLEENQTVRSHLEQLIHRPVANLAQQAAAIDYEYEVFRHDVVPLHPKLALVFFLNNDITDLVSRLSDAEMQHFVDLPIDDHTTRYFTIKTLPGSIVSKLRSAFFHFYVAQTFRLFNAMLRDQVLRTLPPPHNKLEPAKLAMPEPPDFDHALSIIDALRDRPPFAGDPRMLLAMRFHLQALLKMKDFAERSRFHFAYVSIYTGLPDDDLYESVIAAHCRRNNIDFFDLRSDLDKAQRAGANLFLPHDGHFTGDGANVAARALAEHFHLSTLADADSKALEKDGAVPERLRKTAPYHASPSSRLTQQTMEQAFHSR